MSFNITEASRAGHSSWRFLLRPGCLAPTKNMKVENTHIKDDGAPKMPNKPDPVEDFEAIVYAIIAILHLHNIVACFAHLALALIKARHLLLALWIQIMLIMRR